MSSGQMPPFTLLPPGDPQLAPDDELAAAAAAAAALPDVPTPAPTSPPTPFGCTWEFDFELGQFVRAGNSPRATGAFGALAQWCLMAIHSARYAHPVFSDEFGMEDPEDIIGEFAVGEALADWQQALIDALLVHDRITAVENFELDWDPTTGTLTIISFDVVTDEEDRVQISDVTLLAGGIS